MNDPQRIRTALLASLCLSEASTEERRHFIELSLMDLDGEARDRLAGEIAERLLESGSLERVDRFQREGRPYVRYRVPATGETFLLPAPLELREETLVRGCVRTGTREAASSTRACRT